MNPISHNFYGDDSRWFFGYVINSVPPDGLEGRVKVRIIGIHTPDTGDIPERDLPWAQVITPTTEGGSSGIGRIPQLAKGAFVFGVFMDGKTSQIPLVLGSIPHIELPSSIQTARTTRSNDAFVYNQSRIQNVVITPFVDDDINDADVGVRRLQSMKFFIDNGYNPIHAAAITGALEETSQFKTQEIKDVTGIAGWKIEASIGNRFRGLQEFSQAFTPATDWRKFSVQLQYVLFELRTRFGIANTKLVATNNIKDASEAINKYYFKTGLSTDQVAQRAYEEVFV